MRTIKNAMFLKNLFDEYLRENEDIDEFGAWAFGPFYIQIEHGISFMEIWNDLHSDVLKLKTNGNVFEDAPKMVEAWRKSLS